MPCNNYFLFPPSPPLSFLSSLAIVRDCKSILASFSKRKRDRWQFINYFVSRTQRTLYMLNAYSLSFSCLFSLIPFRFILIIGKNGNAKVTNDLLYSGFLRRGIKKKNFQNFEETRSSRSTGVISARREGRGEERIFLSSRSASSSDVESTSRGQSYGADNLAHQ